MLKRLSRDVVVADWQYFAPHAPIETATVFKQANFDCLLCDWDKGESQARATFETIKNQSLMGYIHTTWHTLSEGMPYVAISGIGGFESIDKCNFSWVRTQSATLLRKVMPVSGDYKKAGWSKIQVASLW